MEVRVACVVGERLPASDARSGPPFSHATVCHWLGSHVAASQPTRVSPWFPSWLSMHYTLPKGCVCACRCRGLRRVSSCARHSRWSWSKSGLCRLLGTRAENDGHLSFGGRVSSCVRIGNRRALPVHDLHGLRLCFVFPPCIETQLFTW